MPPNRVERRAAPDFDSATDRYAQRFAGPVGAWFLDVQRRGVERLLADVPPGTPVLEVGGGHAQLVPHLVAMGLEPTVVASDEACAARLQPWLEAGRCRFRVGDLLALPFERGAFPVVISIRLLPHIDPWPRFVAELCRVAARSVVIDYPSRRSVNAWADRLFALKRRVEGDTRPFRVFRPEQIATAFAECGFRLAASVPQFVLPMAFHRLVGRLFISRSLETVAGAIGLRGWLGSPVLVRADRVGRGS
jgi:SAM-dependent methyltransferase